MKRLGIEFLVEQFHKSKKKLSESVKLLNEQIEDQGEPGFADDIIDKLNSIRSGRSFNDSAVSQNLDTYLQNTSDDQKQLIAAFLQGVAQIVTGQVAAAQATPAQDAGVQIVAQNSNVRTVKPTVIKRVSEPGAENTAAPQAAEDTAPPAESPIQVKSR